MATLNAMVLRHGFVGKARYRVLIAKTDSYGSVGYLRQIEELRPNLLGELVWHPCRPMRAFELLVCAWAPKPSKDWSVVWQSDGRRICQRRDILPIPERHSFDYMGADRWWSIRDTPEVENDYESFSARLLEDLCREKFPRWWRKLNQVPCPRKHEENFVACSVCGAEGDDSFRVEPGPSFLVVCKCCETNPATGARIAARGTPGETSPSFEMTRAIDEVLFSDKGWFSPAQHAEALKMSRLRVLNEISASVAILYAKTGSSGNAAQAYVDVLDLLAQAAKR